MQRYTATARMCAREKGYFGLIELIAQYLLRIATLAALLMIWRQLFLDGASPGALTIGQMLSYTLVGSALDPILNVRTPASSWLHDGTMLSMYLRPCPVLAQLAAHTVGSWLLPIALHTIPVLLCAPLLGVSLRPATPWFLLSVPLAVSQGFAIDYLFACLMLRLHNLPWMVHRLREALSALLTGALIPFAALPWGIGNWLSLSPFGTLAGAPLALLTGLDSPLRLIPAQILWNLILWPLALLLFGRARERMVSYGG